MKKRKKSQHLLQLTNIKKGSISLQNCNADIQNVDAAVSSNNASAKIKSDEQKITILSNVKVDRNINMLPYSKELTSNQDANDECTISNTLSKSVSSTMPKIQTIYVNGTSPYKTQTRTPRIYTKDQIMAMPTVIMLSQGMLKI